MTLLFQISRQVDVHHQHATRKDKRDGEPQALSPLSHCNAKYTRHPSHGLASIILGERAPLSPKQQAKHHQTLQSSPADLQTCKPEELRCQGHWRALGIASLEQDHLAVPQRCDPSQTANPTAFSLGAVGEGKACDVAVSPRKLIGWVIGRAGWHIFIFFVI